jgi:hypothetical protein
MPLAMVVSKIFENEHASIEILQEQLLVRLTWKGNASGLAYREPMLKVIEAARTNGLVLLLNDMRRMGSVFFGDQAWTNAEGLPQLIGSGITRIANITSREGINLITADKLVNTVSKEASISIAHFDNLSMAMLWLLDNAEADVKNYVERERLATLNDYQVLDTEAQSSYDDITKIASYIAQTPIALISLVDRKRQWFKSRLGLDAPETSRQISFCTHAIETPDVTFIVKDAAEDPRFANNPLVTGDPNIRFYAGAPLVTPEGFAVGTLCVIDRKPRELDATQLDALKSLARMVVMQLEYRRLALELKSTREDLELYLGHLKGHQRHLEDIMDRQIDSLLPSSSTNSTSTERRPPTDVRDQRSRVPLNGY